MSPTSRHTARALATVAFFALAIATVRPLWNEPGWPDNHEGNLFILRTHIYARHFSWLDLMPIWSSADVSGFGSPLPLMYHKLFYFLAGGLALATPSVKAADVIAIVLLLAGGACGISLTLRAVGASRLAAVIGGCSLIAANYTVTNWLVRGALAEFTSAMLVPWVFLFFVKSLRAGRIVIPLGIALGLLWLSHSVLAYFAGMLLAATFLVMAGMRMTSWSVVHPKTAWPAVACFALLVVPYLVPLAIVSSDYDVTRILTPPFQPEYQFREFTDYLWNERWRFGDRSGNLTVQLDAPMLLLLAAGIVAIARKPDGGVLRRQLVDPVVPFLMVTSLGLLLQLRASEVVYSWTPGARFIQFPWRLLALVTPSLIVSALYLADKTLSPSARSFSLGAAAAGMLAVCGAFAPLRYGRLPVVPDLHAVTFSGFREYEPRVASPVGQNQQRIADRWTESGCSFTFADPGHDETPAVELRAMCGRSAVLPLPVYTSPMHAVGSSALVRTQPCMKLPEFPGICGAVVPAGASSLSVRMPTMASFASWFWRRLWP